MNCYAVGLVTWDDAILIVRYKGRDEFCLPCERIREGEDIEKVLKRHFIENLGASIVRITDFGESFESFSLEGLAEYRLVGVDVDARPEVKGEIEELRWMKREEKLDIDRGYRLDDLVNNKICPFLFEIGRYGRSDASWYDRDIRPYIEEQMRRAKEMRNKEAKSK